MQLRKRPEKSYKLSKNQFVNKLSACLKDCDQQQFNNVLKDFINAIRNPYLESVKVGLTGSTLCHLPSSPTLKTIIKIIELHDLYDKGDVECY